MKADFNKALKASAAPLVLGMALVAGTAQAQSTTKTEEPVIVVTGTLIKNPNLVQANPINVTTAAEIELKQSNTAEEVLRNVPGIVANIGSAVNNGNGGASYVDLRGLGSNRNVVLLDGVRITPADLVGRVDLNNIPLALISRVDSQTGAAVTTYGADAITGVVNFVTKKNFQGLEVSVSDQFTGKGDGNFLRADVTMGGNFAEDRGNAVLSLGYQKSEAIYQGDRDISLYNVDSFSGTAGGSGTTTPARFTVPGAGRLTINPTTGALVSGFSAYNFNPFNIFQTPFSRYNMFAQANYKVSDSVEVYGRALFSKNTVSTIIAPSGLFGTSVTIPYSNPYLPVAMRNQMCAANGLSTAQCDAAALATSTSDANYKTFTTSINRRTPETGTRNAEFATTIFDMHAGVRGDLGSSINWDVRGSYGESTKVQTITGYVLTSRVRDALLATNTSTCLSGNSACVPLNIFGDVGSITSSMANYLMSPASTTVKTSLAQVHGQITGDIGWNLPTATNAISFAAGTEFRSYRASQQADTLAQTAGELGGAGGADPTINGGYKVWEGFGEIIAPLVEDMPGVRSLTVEGGFRYSSYSVTGGTTKTNTFTYKTGLSYEPNSQLKFRANYARAVRAPNISELFSPKTVGLTNLAVDPCAGTAVTTNANLTAICLAQGAPANLIGKIEQPSAGQINITTGGSLNLKPEKADTITIGFVAMPEFLPRFNISVDYYRIKVRDQIGSPLPGDLISACFGNISAASASSAACTSIRRNPATGALDGDPATTFGLLGTLSNQGRLFTDGLDILANYDHTFGRVKWTANVVFNYTAHSKFQATPTSVNRECVGYYSVNCSFTGSMQPKFQWSVRNTFTYGKLDASVLWRHIDAMRQEPLDIIDSGAAYSGTLGSTLGALAGQTVNMGYIKPYDYIDLAFRLNVSKRLTLTATIQNLFDRDAPLVGSTIGSTSYNSGNTYPSTYDALGRRFALAAKVKL